MKKIILLGFCFASIYAGAQNVKVDAGKKIKGNTVANLNMDMGAAAGGEIKIETANTFVVDITGSDNTNYKANNTITKIKMSQEGAGQSTSYDSDNASDTASDMGKELGKTLNQPTAILIDKKTGTTKDANPEKEAPEEDGNPMAALMGGSKSGSDVAGTAFFVIPAGKKAGDTWTDSSAASIPGLVAHKSYQFQSVSNGLATILVKTVTKGTVSKEVQGMQIEVTMDGTANTTITTDTKTGLVSKSVTAGTTEGSMDLMGQTMNFTMTVASTSTFE